MTHGAAPAPGSTSPHQAGGRRPVFRRGLSRFRRRPPWSLIAGPAVTLAMMLWGITAPAYWGDEADTVSAVSRSVPQLLQMLRHTDVVHGLYYLLLWPVVRLLGPGELATRLPSAVAMAAAALGIAAIARRLASDRAALYAGLVFAFFPIISAQAHDARPEGPVTAAAVLASYLLVRALDDPRRRWFAAYGVSLVLLAYSELFGLLLIPAHAITVMALRRRGTQTVDGVPGTVPPGLGRVPQTPSPLRGARGLARCVVVVAHRTTMGSSSALRSDPPGTAARDRQRSTGHALVVRRWLITAAAAVAAVMPLVAYGWQQRAEIGWIAKPSWHDVLSAIVSMAAGSTLAIVIGLLAVLGGCVGNGGDRRRGPARTWLAGLPRLTGLRSRPGGADRALTWLALPWLVLPVAMLLAASEIIPAYSFRYLVFCLPGTALLAGAGLAALGWAVRAVALALIVALAAPTQFSIRVPGTGMRAVSQFLAVRERRGDAVIYPGSGVPPWYLAYPNGLGRLRDIWMAVSGPASGRLYGLRVSTPVLEQRERGVCRVWAAEMSPPWLNPAQYLPGFRLAGAWQPQPGVRLWLYAKPGCVSPHGASR